MAYEEEHRDEESDVAVPKLALTEVTEASLAKTRAETVGVGTVQGTGGLELAPGAEAVDAAFGGTLADVLATLGATGAAEEVVKVPSLGRLASDVVLAVGLGKPEVTAEQVRRASGAAGRALAGTKRALTTLSAVDLQAAVEGIALGAYTFTEYKSDKGDK